MPDVAASVDHWFFERGRRRALRRPMPAAPSVRVLDLPDAWVRALVVGSGPTVVMVPDPPNTIEHHAALVERLRRTHRVVCFEIPGFGLSFPKRSMAATVRGQVAVFEQVFAALEVTGAVLAVSCLGAYVAAQFALDCPRLVDRLVLIQVPDVAQAVAWSRKADVAGLIATPVVGQVLCQCLQPLIIRQWYRSAMRPGRDPAQVRHYTGVALDVARHGGGFCLASAYQTLQNWRDGPDWRGLSRPTLLVHGARDPTHAATRWERLPALIGDCHQAVFADSGHFPNLEEPDRFVALLRDWR
jgi:pimeloyl-ACP methyl ester carboxylesterase